MNNRIWESEGKKTLVSTQKNILFEGRRLTRLVSLGSFKTVSMASWVISAQEAASTVRGGGGSRGLASAGLWSVGVQLLPNQTSACLDTFFMHRLG